MPITLEKWKEFLKYRDSEIEKAKKDQMYIDAEKILDHFLRIEKYPSTAQAINRDMAAEMQKFILSTVPEKTIEAYLDWLTEE